MGALLGAVAMTLLFAQSTSDVKSTAKGDPVTVRGCVRGSILVVLDLEEQSGSDIGTPVRYQLKASKEVLRQLAEADPFQVEVHGVVRAMSKRRAEPMRVTRGKTNIYVGAETSPDPSTRPEELAPAPPRLDVESFTVLVHRCPGR